MAEGTFEIGLRTTTGDIFLNVCEEANAVLEDLDTRRREEYGRGYNPGYNFSERVPDTELTLRYIPLPGSSAETTIKHAGSSKEVLRIVAEYTKRNGKIAAITDRGTIQTSYYDQDRQRLDFSLSSYNGGGIRLASPGLDVMFPSDKELASLPQDYQDEFALTFRGLVASIKAAERMRDGSGFWAAMRRRRQEFFYGI